MICELAIATNRLPSEWEREEPVAIATAIQILEEIRQRQEAAQRG